MMKSEVIKASQAIANLSDQVEGYSQEIARTVIKISEQYNVSKEFALLIVQTGIENMKVDTEHHKNYHIELIADSLTYIAESLNNIADNIPR